MRSKRQVSRRRSNLPNIPERIILSFRLCKSREETFGFTIVGGNNHLLNGIYIKSITQGKFADRDGRLKQGDQIVSVNNKNFLDISHDDAVSLLTKNNTILDLIISRMIDTSITSFDPPVRKISPMHLHFLSFNSDLSDEEPDILEFKSISQ